MTCYHPLRAYRSLKMKSETGKSVMSFARKEVSSGPFEVVDVACGRCIGCRVDKSREWALRCVHESSLHESNCFITLTYDDEHLPEYGSLCKRDFQLFMKKLRKGHDDRIRFFHCGEYGDDGWRPHYHAILFGYDFPDKSYVGRRKGNSVYRSDELEERWPKGFSLIGDMSWSAAAYVARYVLKKVSGEAAADRYIRDVNVETGEAIVVEPEYITMSRRPGLGKGWLEKYAGDCYPKDFVTVDGRKFAVPGYYDSVFEDVETLDKVKYRRRYRRDVENSTLERLATREVVKKSEISRLERSFEKCY